MNKQKILILGGAGFIASNLINFYSQNPDYEVYSTIHKQLPYDLEKLKERGVIFYTVDLTLKEDVNNLFDLVRPEICILLAANTSSSKDVIERPFVHATDNYIINSLVLEAAYVCKVKHFFYTSCSTMLLSKELPQKETDWNPGDEIYPAYDFVANLKLATEKLCKSYSKLKNNECKFTVLRLSNIFGPKDKTDLNRAHVLMSTVLKVCNATESIEIWGDKNNEAKRDLVYIDDLVNLVDRALNFQKTPYELYNCGCGKAYPITEIVKTVQKVLNKEYLKLEYNNNKPSIPVTISLDFTKAYEELGWYPKVSLEEGIRNTVEWYKENY